MTLDQLMTQATQAHQQGGLQQAEALYRQALEIAPDHPQVLHFLGLVCSQQGKYEESVQYLQRAIQLNPQNPVYHNNLGEAFRRQGNSEQAIMSYRQAVILAPNFAEAHYNLANALKAKENISEAIEHYQCAINLRADYTKAYFNLGNTLHEQDQLEKAMANYQKAIQLQPNFTEAQNNLEIARQKHLFRENLLLLHDVLAKTAFSNKYWVTFGLLIGWARERRVLSWDYKDADFAYLTEDRDLFPEVIDALTGAGFKLGVKFINNAKLITEYRFFKDDAHFEFFEMYPQNDMLHYFTYGFYRGENTEMKCAVPKHYLSKFEFLDRVWLKPADHDSYLTVIYGDWRTPKRNYDYTEDDQNIIERSRWFMSR